MAKAKEQWQGYSWPVRRDVVPSVVSVSVCERPPRGPTGRIVNALWALDYARSDCGRVRVGSPRGRWWRRAAGTAHLYPPGTPYWEDESAAQSPVREAWVIFAGGEQTELRELVPAGRDFARIADPEGRIDTCLREMALAGRALGEAGFWQVQVHLAGLFDALSRAVRRKDGSFALPGVEAEADEDLVGATHAFFREHMGEKITVASVARHLGISRSAFSHRYAQQTGRPPMAALTAMRLDVAAGLLLKGLKLEAIARQLGFFDAFHFSKTFRKHRGMSPSRFRRQFGADSADES